MSERIKRPEPERTEPIRNWSTLFGPPNGQRRPEPDFGAFMPPGFPGAPPFPGIPSPFPGVPSPFPGVPSGPGEAVSRGVATGYRVIEEYMRQGRDVARNMWGGFGGGGRGADDPQRMDGMMRYASQMTTLWLDMMSMVLPGMLGGYPAPPTGTAGPFWMGREHDAGGAPAPAGFDGGRPPVVPGPAAHDPGRAAPAPETQGGEPTAVVVEVASPRPTEVSLDLRPRSLGLPLRVHDLRAPEPDKPRLEDVTVTADPDGERVRVRVRVPEGQPPGVYSGIILDERTSLPRGTLTVRVA